MSGGEPGTRTLNLAVKSRLLCQIELAPLTDSLTNDRGLTFIALKINSHRSCAPISTKQANWGGRWDSNPRRPGSQPGALPAELRPPLNLRSLSN